MRRREVLFAMGGVVSLAGCSETSEPTPTFDEPAQQNTPVRTATRTPRPRGDAEIVNTQLITGDSVFGEIPWAVVDIENKAEVIHGQLEVQVRFYNGDDELMTTRSGFASLIPESTTWRYYQRLGTEDRDELDHIETSIVGAEPLKRIGAPESVEVTESELVADPDSGVTVTGAVATGEYDGALEVIALLYDVDERFRGTVRTVNTELRSGETWRFDIGSIAVRTPQDRPQVDDHMIVVNTW